MSARGTKENFCNNHLTNTTFLSVENCKCHVIVMGRSFHRFFQSDSAKSPTSLPLPRDVITTFRFSEQVDIHKGRHVQYHNYPPDFLKIPCMVFYTIITQKLAHFSLSYLSLERDRETVKSASFERETKERRASNACSSTGRGKDRYRQRALMQVWGN